MNAFYEHHKNSIRFHYRCFDRILLNGLIQPFQQERELSVSLVPIVIFIRSAATSCVRSQRSFRTG